jgi:alkylresorcinol/alkylpyrone synthase
VNGPAPRVVSVATAVPPHRVGQEDARDFARRLFSGAYRDIERLLPVFENAGIEERYFCVPPEWFEREHTFPERNSLYIEGALDLSEKAARRAMDRAGVEPGEVGAIFFVSTTGISTPSLDSKLLFRLGLSRHVRRVPIWGLGCAGGAAGLARAAEHARLYPAEPVLLVAVELCGLSFQRGDLSKSNLIATSLFGDGVAAALIQAREGSGPELTGGFSTTWPGTEDVMGWDLIESGLKVRFAKSVPQIVRERMRGNLEVACAACDLSVEDIQRFVLHPGGPKVLEAYEDTLEIRTEDLDLSREVLRRYGNMSSPTVLFVLERFLQSGEFFPGDPGVLTSMGPGFSAEHVFFRC